MGEKRAYKTRRRATPQEITWAKWLISQGATVREIANRSGFTKSAVRLWLKPEQRKPYVKKRKLYGVGVTELAVAAPDYRTIIVDDATRIAYDHEDKSWRVEVIVARAGARPEWGRILWARFGNPEAALDYLSGPHARIGGS